MLLQFTSHLYLPITLMWDAVHDVRYCMHCIYVCNTTSSETPPIPYTDAKLYGRTFHTMCCADRQVSHLISNYTIPHNTTALCDMPFHVTTQTNDASYFTLSYKTTLYDMSCATQDVVCCLKALPLSYEHLILILPTPPPPSLSFHLNLQVQII